MILLTFTLACGVELDGVTHTDVELGPLSVADQMLLEASRKKATADKVDEDVAVMDYLLQALARQIRKLGSIPRERITAAFLRERLLEPDLVMLAEAREELSARYAAFRRRQLHSTTGAGGGGGADGLVRPGAAPVPDA